MTFAEGRIRPDFGVGVGPCRLIGSVLAWSVGDISNYPFRDIVLEILMEVTIIKHHIQFLMQHLNLLQDLS